MQKFRISATTLVSWRNYLRDSIDQEEFERRLLGISEPSEAMVVGTAFHKIIENRASDHVLFLPDNGGKVLVQDDILFASETIEPIVESLPPAMIHEIKVVKHYNFGGYGVDLVTIADGLFGNMVVEFKTTWRNPIDFDKYADSMQWRCNMLNFGVDIARHEIFLLGKNGQMNIEVFDKVSFSSYRYDGLYADIEEKVIGLIDYLIGRGLVTAFHNKNFKKREYDYLSN